MREATKQSFGRPKTPAEIQAQIENYVERHVMSPYSEDSAVEYYENKKKAHDVLKSSSELALLSKIHDLPTDTDEEMRTLVAQHEKRYLSSLQQHGGKELAFQTECIERYGREFKPIVKKLLAQISQAATGEELRAIEGYINSGFEGHVFKTETRLGSYVIKIFKNGDISQQQLDAMRRAKDIENVSHLVAYSHQDQAMIMDFFNGQNLGLLTKAEKPRVTAQELRSATTTFVELYKINIRLDTNLTKGGNIMFDGKSTFFFIDYHTMYKHYHLADAIKDLARVIAYRADNLHTEEYNTEVANLSREITQILKHDFPEFYRDHRVEIENGPDEHSKMNFKKILEWFNSAFRR